MSRIASKLPARPEHNWDDRKLKRPNNQQDRKISQQSRFYTHIAAARQQHLLHRNALTHKPFYTQRLLHTKAFTHNIDSLLHTNTFAHKRLYTETPLHTNPFTPKDFYTQMHFYTQTLLYKCTFYTQTSLHRNTRTHKPIYTQRPLHTDSFTRKNSRTNSFRPIDFYTHTIFTRKHFYTETP